MPGALATMGLSISGWPEAVPFPFSSRGRNLGLKNLRAKYVRILLPAFENKKTRPVFHLHDKDGKHAFIYHLSHQPTNLLVRTRGWQIPCDYSRTSSAQLCQRTRLHVRR